MAIDEKEEKNQKKSKDTLHKAIRSLAFNAIIAALYCVLTFILQPISFGAVQFRFSEILILLCFWRKDLIIGLTVGCLVSNAFSFSFWDMLIGTSATLISCIFMVFLSPRLFVSAIWPVVFNGLIVGAELTWIYPAFPEYWQNALSVAGGELVVMIVGYLLWMLVYRNAGFRRLLEPNIHTSILY